MNRMRNHLGALVGTFLVAFLTGIATPPASAQSTDQDVQILAVENDDHPAIVLTVAIPPEFADGPLGSSDFAVTEEGNPRPAGTTDLRNDIEVVLAIDTSGSMRPNDALAKAKLAALAMIDQLPNETRIGVVGFGSEVLVASPLTIDRETLTEAIDRLDFSGDTSLWDALTVSADQFRAKDDVSRYVVVITDGVDDGSSATIDGAISALQDADSALYAVGLETGTADFDDLQAVVSVVGGSFSSAESADSLDSLYAEIGERLTSRYQLVFQAEGTGEREIVVSVATDGGLAITRQVIDLGGIAEAAPAAEASLESAFPSQLNNTIGTDVTWLGQGWIFWVGIASMFVALAVLSFLVVQPARRVRMATVQRGGDNVAGFSARLTGAADGYLAGSDRGSSLDRTLDAAGLEIRPGEVFVFTLVGTMLGLLIGLSLNGLFLGLLLATVAPLIAYTMISRRLRKRRAAFADQLEGTLTMMAGALRAGRAVPQTLDLVAEESPAPTSEEFQRVVIESRVGRDAVDSLEDVSRRMDNEDFEWVAEAVAINRELGGDLAEVFENIAGVVRGRNQVRQQIQALAAEGRMSAYILIALPVSLFFYIQIVNPSYGRELLRGSGLAALIVGIVLIILGGIWMRNLVKLKY